MKTHLLFRSSDAPAGGSPAPTGSTPPPSVGASGTPAAGAAASPAAPTGAPAGAPTGSPPVSGAEASPQPGTGAVASGAPSPTPVAERAALSALDSLLRSVADPTPPKDYTPENFTRYQQEVANAQAWRSFQQSMRDVVSKPTVFADGVQHVFTSPEEVQEFGAFARDITSGKIPITGKDLLMLFRGKNLLQQASDYGARQYESGLRTRSGAPNSQQAAPAGQAVVPLREPEQASTPGGVPSVATILKQKNPEFYDKLMKGQVALT